jgi:small-conductance mechanosensitive channel
MDLFYLWRMRGLWLMLGLSSTTLVPSWAQELGPAEALQAPALAVELDTLRALADSHAQLLTALREKQAAIKAAAGGAETDVLKRELIDLETRRATLEQDFAAVATGVTAQDYLGSAELEGDLNLQQELSRILAPILAEVRNLSKKPRAIQELQTTLATQKHRVDLAQVAVTSLEVQLAAANESKESEQSALIALLKQLHASWQARLAEAKSRVLAIERQLEELQGEQVGLWALMTGAVQTFFLTRGRVILLAILSFLVVYFGLRFLYFHVLRVVPIAKMEQLSFFFRALALLNQGLSIGLGVLAALIVLYASGDWLLSAVAMLILLAIALAAKSGFVRYFDQVKMLLNVGSAREGERVLINGVPWRIGTINLQTRLSNPCIDGPGLRLPLEALMGMTSRPVAKNESWFPCRSGEMVLLPNDLLARVEQVHADYVELRYRAGVTRQIPTSEFIKLQPENLSGGFLVSTTFGLDYSLQADITQRIPQQMVEDLKAGLLKLVPEDQLVEVKVEFKEAAASSLDLLLVAKFKGGCANLFMDLRRGLQRLAVESATAHDWPIPFPQLTVHQAIAANHRPTSA